MSSAHIPVLEVGGTHVTAAVVLPERWSVEQAQRVPLDSNADADHILDTFVDACAALDAPPDVTWGVAMPDPFDYQRGVATFRDVGKFDSLFGMDVGRILTDRLPQRPAGLAFVNDADAFILGEWAHGAATGYSRCVGITLGTGLGSGWLIDGHVTDSAPGVPALGRARHLIVNGSGLEDTVSRRAIRRAYSSATGDDRADVRDIAERARTGDGPATGVLAHAFRGLGTAMGPAMKDFGAEVVVIGGSMAGSWDLFEQWFREGLDWPAGPPVVLAADAEDAALLGAARFVLDR